MKNYGIEIEIIDKSGKNINGKELKNAVSSSVNRY